MVKTSLSRDQIATRTIKYMAQKNFNLASRSEYQLVFTGGKDINILFLAFWVLFFIVGGILYYLLTKTHSITVSIIEKADGIDVQTNASTDLSNKIADEFLKMLETFDNKSYRKGYRIQEMKCPKCGSALDFTGHEKIVNCKFCGSKLAINEIRKYD
jgi:DNA-directed RNA polymerase subunit RPC12/RpoP